MRLRRTPQALPVAVDVGSAEGKAVVDEGGVNEDPPLRPLQQVVEVTQVPVAAAHTVACTVLIQDKHLAGAEPTLRKIASFMKTGDMVHKLKRPSGQIFPEELCMFVHFVVPMGISPMGNLSRFSPRKPAGTESRYPILTN